MNILILGARGIPAKWGGFDTFVTHLAPRLVKKGHRVTVFCQPKYSLPERPDTFEGVRLIYVPTLYGKNTETFVHELLCSLYALVRLRGFDLYYILGCRSTVVYLPHWILRRTLVINTDGLDWARRKWGFVARSFLKFNYWLARQIANHLVSDSKELKRFYLERYNRQTAFLTNGGEIVTERKPDVVRSYGLEPGEYLLVACRLEPENNIDTILREFEKTSIPKKLVIAGGANYKSPYIDALKRTRDPRVIFLGPVYTEGHIEQLHIHGYAYLHGHEVGGTNPSLLKAMACGNIILAHDVRFNKEVLGGCGILWTKDEGDLKAKLDRMHRDHNRLANDLAPRCLLRIQTTYTWDKVGDDHDLFFRWVKGEVESFRESF